MPMMRLVLWREAFIGSMLTKSFLPMILMLGGVIVPSRWMLIGKKLIMIPEIKKSVGKTMSGY